MAKTSEAEAIYGAAEMLSDAIVSTFFSPRERCGNNAEANVVDVLADLNRNVAEQLGRIADGLFAVAEAIAKRE